MPMHQYLKTTQLDLIAELNNKLLVKGYQNYLLVKVFSR